MFNNITKKAAFIALSAAALFIASCKKDDAIKTNPGSVTVTGRLLAKVEEDDTHYSTFDYNGDNLVSKIGTKTGNTTEAIDLTYNAAKKVATATANSNQIKFIYSNNVLSKVEYYGGAPDNQLSFYTEFTNTNGKVTELKSFANYPGTQGGVLPSFKIVYTYNAAGDVVTEKQYLWAPYKNDYGIYETTNYEYDDKVNPLAATTEIAQTFFQVTSAHNVVKQSRYDALGQLVETNIYTYVYDAKGYPTTATEKTTTKENPNVVTSTVKYTYKN